MIALFLRHWRHYLAEALGLGFFMAGASLVTAQLRYREAWLYPYIPSTFIGLCVLGFAMFFVVLAIIYSPWGNKSGAHINPAVTIAMLWLGKIEWRDALFYLISQFAGGILAVQLMGLILGRAYTDAGVNYVVTGPGPDGPIAAFIAEWIITFGLIMVLLWALNDEKREKYAGLMIATLLAFYLIVEEPFSGMSLNPARSFASALAAREWEHLWIYFAAPISAALVAAEIFYRATGGAPDLAAHPSDSEDDERTKTPQQQGKVQSPAATIAS